MSKRTLSLTLLLSLGFLWGTGYAIARYVMTHGIPAASYSFWESLGPAFLLFLLALYLRKPATTSAYSLSHLRYYLIAGLTGIAIPNTCMYFAAAHLPAGLLAVIVNTVPVIAWPLAVIAGLERIHLPRLLGLTLAITGLAFIVLPKSELPAGDSWGWMLLALITPFSFALCTVHITKFRPQGTGPVPIAAGMMIAASMLLLPMVLLSGDFYVPSWPLSVPDALIILETVLSSLGYILFFELLRVAGPVYYSLVDTTVSLTGLASGYFLFHEKIGFSAGCGIVLILLGVLFVTLTQQLPGAGIEPARGLPPEGF